MKPHFILTSMLLTALSSGIMAQTPKARYITRKSTLLGGRTMNNVAAVMDAGDIKFVVPPGSINTSLIVDVYKEEGTLIVPSGTPGDSFARLDVKTEKFDGPVEVHIPIKSPGKIPVAYAVDKSDAWEPLTFKEVSPDKATAIYLTQKPITVAWIIPN